MYGKGGAYFRQLEKRIGPEEFQKGVQNIVKNYSGKNFESFDIFWSFANSSFTWSKIFV